MNIAAWKCGEERTDYARAAHAVCLNVSVVLLEELVWYLPVERLSSLRPNQFPFTSICVPFLSVFLRSVFLFIVA